MATVSSVGNVNYQSNVAANIRNWAGKIESLLTAIGWVQTADTGQTAAASLPATSLGNQSVGYQVWRMADSLQATAPVYMKIEFGSAAGSNTATAGVWITLGTSSDGAGNITGAYLARTQVSTAVGGAAGSTGTFYGSGGTNRIVFAMLGAITGNNNTTLLSIERTKDGAGSDKSDGLLITCACAQSAPLTISLNQCLKFTGVSNASSSNLIAFAPSGTTWADGTAVGTCPVRYNDGTPSNPCLNLMVYLNADTPAGTQISQSVYGASHFYMPLGSTPCSTVVPGQANASLMIRWD